MNRIFRSLILAAMVLAGWHCSGPNSKKVNTADQDIKLIPVHLLDSVEHFFGNENWMLLNGKDTSFILFSRQSTPVIKTYHYIIQEGDSARCEISNMDFNGDTLVWRLNHEELRLLSADQHVQVWKNGKDSAVYKVLSPGKIEMDTHGEKITLVKTLTLSDFLVRSRYDWKNGTHYAFDTVNFNRLLHEKKIKEDKPRELIHTGAN